MAANITCDEVRNRLRELTSTDVSDTILNSAAFIPAADVWLLKMGVTYASLGANDQVLAKAAEIAWVAARVVASAPVRGARGGPVEIIPIAANQKRDMYDILIAEAKEMLSLLDVNMSAFYCTSSGGSDYDPDSDTLESLHIYE